MKNSGLRFKGLAAVLLVAASASSAFPAQQLDTTQFIVVGEGLAAGMADFQLRDINQTTSFPAVMAGVFKTAFPLPILQSPGIGSGAPGFPALPPRLPAQLQGTVRNDFPPDLFVFNLSIPGFKLNDSLSRRPSAPLIQNRDLQQTLTNFVLGYPALIAGAHLPLWTQVEYAIQMNPTLVVLELGYYDVLDPAATNNPAGLPDVSAFTSQFNSILSRINAGSSPQIIVMTVPDPFDTAYFTPVANATAILGAPASVLTSLFKLGAGDYLTPTGLMTAGSAIAANIAKPAPLSATPNAVVSAATATAVHTSVAAINNAITAAAKQAGPNVIVYDLQAYFGGLRQTGLTVGTRTLTADYMGGLYSLDGYYPGQTVQASIANNMLTLLNKTYGKSFATVNLNTVADGDPALRFTPTVAKRAISRIPVVRRGVTR